MPDLSIDTTVKKPPTRDFPASRQLPQALPEPKEIRLHPKEGENRNARLLFVGTATTIMEWEGLRLMTDPNFLHAGDHVHLGPGVTGVRKTNPAVDLHDLPSVDMVLLSHYHGDHFDQKVEASLRRDLPIISTPHAHSHLTNKGDESFTDVYALDFWQDMMINVSGPTPDRLPRIHVTGMPGKHVPTGVLAAANDLVHAVPPTNGWMLELGYRGQGHSDFQCGYRIYISGDTLLVDELKEIPKYYNHANKPIDLMLIHLGGTTLPSPSLPLLMVTMDDKQGIELVKLIQPELTIPVHYDDYDVFLSSLDDFKNQVKMAGLEDKVVYLDRGDVFEFTVRDGTSKGS